MIRAAKVNEIPRIIDFTQACGAAMRARGIFQWTPEYPSRNAFARDIKRGELWVYEQEGQVIGTVVLSSQMDEEYQHVRWLTENRANRYIHRLAVDPAYQGRGIAQALMDFAETRTAAEGAVSIRLDTFSRNSRNQHFYEQRGYIRLGAVYFPSQSPYPFYCYERIITP